VGGICKAKPDAIGRWIAAQIGVRLVWHRVRGAELVHAHEPRDETAFRNPDRDLMREVAVDPTLGDFALAHLRSSWGITRSLYERAVVVHCGLSHTGSHSPPSMTLDCGPSRMR
jgi:hypothetical protein